MQWFYRLLLLCPLSFITPNVFSSNKLIDLTIRNLKQHCAIYADTLHLEAAMTRYFSHVLSPKLFLGKQQKEELDEPGEETGDPWYAWSRPAEVRLFGDTLLWASLLFFGYGRREEKMLPRFIVPGVFWSQAGWVLHEDVAATKLQMGQQEIKPQEHSKIGNRFTDLQIGFADTKENPTALNNRTQGCDLLPLTSPIALSLRKLGIPGVLTLPP